MHVNIAISNCSNMYFSGLSTKTVRDCFF